MSTTNVKLYCQGYQRGFNGNKNRQGKITSANLTQHLSSLLGMSCREVYKKASFMNNN